MPSDGGDGSEIISADAPAECSIDNSRFKMVPCNWLGPQPSFREFHAYSHWLLRTLPSNVAFSAKDWPITHISRRKHDVRLVVPVRIFDTDRHQDM